MPGDSLTFTNRQSDSVMVDVTDTGYGFTLDVKRITDAPKTSSLLEVSSPDPYGHPSHD
jgi:hypothetical protein